MRHHGEDTNTLLSALSLAGSGLAAGALAIATPAHATVLVNNYNDVNIGFGSHATTQSFVVSFSHEPFFGIVGSLTGTAAFNDFRATIAAVTSSHNILTLARPVPRGTTQPFSVHTSIGTGWNTEAVINARSIGGATLPSPVPAGNQYYLFTILGEFFGWFSGSLVNTSSQVYFHLKQAAVDTTPGALLPAGSVGVPEPGSLGLLGLAAMVTGAAATRRYKRGLAKARAKRAATAEGGAA